MSVIATSTVFGAKAERLPGTVQLQVTTDHGLGRLRFTPATARQIGRELMLAADQHDTAAAPRATIDSVTGGRVPITKPSGHLS